ncbi:hypothetical protein R3P38DRAFT_789172 [Favolaschia claudopus]|uniref:Telomerase reverse transcriptase n=1 Tax=Favolaschia claudopus TaxID=2862362 RepID=A0AAW0C6A2_9AGAR
MSNISEVVDRAIEKLLKSSAKTSRQNVITAGYTLDDRKGRNITSAFLNTHVNTNIVALQAPEWATLLERIGTDAMLHLLTDTSIFITLPNDCFCQLVGEPIIYIHLDDLRLKIPADQPIMQRPAKRALPFSEEGLRGPTKRAKLSRAGFSSATAVGSKTHELPPSKVLLVRGRLFYGRAMLQWHSKEIAVGLPPKRNDLLLFFSLSFSHGRFFSNTKKMYSIDCIRRKRTCLSRMWIQTHGSRWTTRGTSQNMCLLGNMASQVHLDLRPANTSRSGSPTSPTERLKSRGRSKRQNDSRKSLGCSKSCSGGTANVDTGCYETTPVHPKSKRSSGRRLTAMVSLNLSRSTRPRLLVHKNLFRGMMRLLIRMGIRFCLWV